MRTKELLLSLSSAINWNPSDPDTDVDVKMGEVVEAFDRTFKGTELEGKSSEFMVGTLLNWLIFNLSFDDLVGLQHKKFPDGLNPLDWVDGARQAAQLINNTRRNPMRAAAFETIAILLANATSDEERKNLRTKLSILCNRDDDRAASVVRELINMKVELCS